MNNTRMPDIKILFQESWALLKIKFGSIFLLSLLGSVVGFVVMIVFLVGIAGAGFLATLSGDMNNKGELIKQAQSFLTPAHIAQLATSILGIFLVGWVISSVVRIAIIVAIGKKDERVSLGNCLSRGFSLFIPVMIVGSVVSFVVFGSFFLFIIPAIIISLLFQFVAYEMILADKKWLTSIKSSVQIMSQHFGEVLMRMFIFFVSVYLAFNLPIYLIQMVARSYSESAPAEAASVLVVLGIIRFIVGIFITFFGLVYSVVTYQHAKNATDESLPVRMTWIWVVSILGWIIAGIVGAQLFKLSKTQFAQETMNVFKNELSTNNQKELSQDEKVAQWENKINGEARPYWDKSNDLFKQMKEQSNDPKTVKKLNDENITSLLQAIKLDGENPVLWKNLSDAYWWINSKGTLEDALAASRKAEALDPTIWGYKYGTGILLTRLQRYDEAILKLQEVVRAEDNYGMGHIELGIAYNRSGLKSQAAEHLERGIEILTNYNKDGQFDQEILAAQKELETTK